MRKSLVYFVCFLFAICAATVEDESQSFGYKNQVSTNISIPIFESVDVDYLILNSDYDCENQQVEAAVEQIQTTDNQLDVELTVMEN